MYKKKLKKVDKVKKVLYTTYEGLIFFLKDMKTTFTTEQKRKYFQNLRNKWDQAKKEIEKAGKRGEIANEMEKHGITISPISFWLVMKEMYKLGLEGMPYVDCMTFNKWKEKGFKVRKGEKAKITGITWKVINKDESDKKKEEDVTLIPKTYKLFHSTQVEPIKLK